MVKPRGEQGCCTARALPGSRPVCHREGVSAVWFECTVAVPLAYSEAVGNFLMESGAPGLQVEERDGLVTLTAHFPSEPPVESLRRFSAYIGYRLSGCDAIRIRKVPDQNWAENWKAHFEPQLIGQRLYICPPWDCAPPAGRVAVIIDPGMAFGTGQHPSTRGCLQLLDGALWERQTTRALDVGTGSGVLAIAMAKLGVTAVWAVDTDANACAIAATNARANGVDGSVRVVAGLDDVRGTFGLIAANLFANALEELAAPLAHVLQPKGMLICSGLLVSDEDRVQTAYEAQELRLKQRYCEAPWVTLAFERREHS